MSEKQYYYLRIINTKEGFVDYEINITNKQAKSILNRWKTLNEIPGFIILYSPLQKKLDLTYSTTYSAYIQFSENIMYEIYMLEPKQLTNIENGSQGSKWALCKPNKTH